MYETTCQSSEMIVAHTIPMISVVQIFISFGSIWKTFNQLNLKKPRPSPTQVLLAKSFNEESKPISKAATALEKRKCELEVTKKVEHSPIKHFS
ncbi:MAG TPA: hypothetical protein PLL06_19890 [Acidobacteriota bacterium]|nr:hypothetical protein [Acidobacteriota bacterium]HND21602.1 hypothetical protein [Acidobacteriota bacterium]HNH85164.1 hypothetical protein [Acidobacteriota bacterium]